MVMWQWLVGRRCHRQWGGGALGFTSEKSDPHQIQRPNDRSMERTQSLFVDDLASRQQRW
eukprot:scaffold1803_cov195-Alexandrium_tamarense.AAC.32